MFEKYIEQKEQSIADLFNLDLDYTNLYELMFNPKLDLAYKAYFSAEVDWWIYEEQVARISNIRFNFDDPRLASFLTKLDDLYKKNARFSNQSLPMIISSAVKTRLNMLIRPRTAIKWFAFRWEQSKTYQEIIKRLNYLADNKYLANGFIDYVQRKNIIKSPNDIITISQFDKIITEVDNEKLESLTPEDFIALMNPLFSFFNADSDHSDTAKIPVEAVIIYFDDKNLYSLSTKLEQKFRSGELLLISKKYLLGIIYKSLYDADNLYGSDEDNITTVTKEIEDSHNNYINLADGLKNNLSFDLGTKDNLEPEYETKPDLSEENLYEETQDLEDSESEIESDFNLPEMNLNSFSDNNKNISEDSFEEVSNEMSDEIDSFDNQAENIEMENSESSPIEEEIVAQEEIKPEIDYNMEDLSENEQAEITEFSEIAGAKKNRFNDILNSLLNELND